MLTTFLFAYAIPSDGNKIIRKEYIYKYISVCVKAVVPRILKYSDILFKIIRIKYYIFIIRGM